MKKILQNFSFKRGSDGIITGCMLLLAFIGVIMTTSTSVGMERNYTALISYLIKQGGFLLAGLLVMNYTANKFYFKKVERNYLKLTLIMGILLLLTLFFPSVNGAKAWIRLPLGMSIQPSEFFKVYLIVLIGVCVEKTRHKKIAFKDAFFPIFCFGGIGLFIVSILQKDFGTAVITLGISYILLMIPYHYKFTKVQSKLILFGIVLVILLILVLSNPVLDLIINAFGGENASYKFYRFVAARNPFAIQDSAGYQLIFGLEAIARGGLLGTGFGNSTIKFLIPEGRTDYIMAIVAEELGLVGFLAISFIMFLIVIRLIRYALIAKNESFKVILIGVALYFILHYIFNIGGISGLIPLTGVPLLMISAGGTSLMAVFMGIGVCQSIISVIKRDMSKKQLGELNE